jgi:hypothetical protein
MADQIGMPRRFFQDHPWRWHYDLPAHLRTAAVRCGAEPVSTETIATMLKARRVEVKGRG